MLRWGSVETFWLYSTICIELLASFINLPDEVFNSLLVCNALDHRALFFLIEGIAAYSDDVQVRPSRTWLAGVT